MKQYKVGDTIYLKALVAEVDKDDPEKTYGVNFVHQTYGIQAWPECEAIIDELPTAEPVKPVLPKAVADEMKSAKEISLNFYGYLDSKLPLTHSFVFDNLGDSDDQIKILSDAWYNGYTVEKEPTWYIEVPGKFNRPTYYAINDGALAFGYLDEDKKWYRDYSAHAFTDEEIKKYDLENFKKELVNDD